MANKCDKCGKSFDTKRGLSVHQGQVHKDTDEKKEKLMIIQLLDSGKKTASDIADVLGENTDRVKGHLQELMEKDYVKEHVESGREAFYTVTEEGRKRIPPLLKDILQQTKDFAEGVGKAFKKHFGDIMPKIRIEWKEKDKD